MQVDGGIWDGSPHVRVRVILQTVWYVTGYFIKNKEGHPHISSSTTFATSVLR